MAVMISTRTLRDAPGGNSIGIDAPARAKVSIIATQSPWVEIEIAGIPDTPKGWVAQAAVDPNSDTPGPLDKLAFTSQCAWQAIIYDVSAHYLVAVASLRTDITDGPHANGAETGPFSLSPLIWAAYAQRPEVLGQFATADIDDWLVQCVVFAVITRITQKTLAALLSDQPTVRELYLAQIVGTAAAAAAIADPSASLATKVNAVDSSDLAREGIEPQKIPASLLNLTGAAALDKLGAALDTALKSTSQFIATVAAEILSSSDATLSPTTSPSVSINFDAAKIPPKRKDMAQLIVQRFQEAGYGAIQEVAALANAIAESGLDPTIKSAGTEKSYGLFQLNQNGVGAGHSADELRDPERNIAIMLQYMSGEEHASDLLFRAATSLQDAVSIFVRKFERPADTAGAITTRLQIAVNLVH
jgi:hypothetical protein